jgi:hypothetical protein
MTGTKHAPRRLDDLSESELVAVRMLINSLSKVEYWIGQNVAKLRDGSDHQAIGTGLRIDVRCMLHESDPCFDPCGENVVATLGANAIALPGPAATDNCRHVALDPDMRALSDMRIGRLFCDLYENGVGRDWDALVRIGEISAEISLSHVSKARDGE